MSVNCHTGGGYGQVNEIGGKLAHHFHAISIYYLILIIIHVSFRLKFGL